MNIGKSPAIRNIGNKFGVEFAYITNMIAAETEQSSHSVRKNPGMPMMSEPYDMVRLSMLPGVGPNRGRTLANAFSGFDELRRTSVAAVLRLGVFTRQFAGALVSSLRDEGFQEKLESGIARCRARAAELGAGLLPWYHEDYPEPLRYIYDAPLYLFRTGSWQPADASGIAVVGTRAPSEYGRSVAAHISRELAERGVTTVSGLAFGIDTIVHESTIGNNGRTIAVLGSGLGRVYPTANRSLADKRTRMSVFRTASRRFARRTEFPAQKPDHQRSYSRNRGRRERPQRRRHDHSQTCPRSKPRGFRGSRRNLQPCITRDKHALGKRDRPRVHLCGRSVRAIAEIDETGHCDKKAGQTDVDRGTAPARRALRQSDSYRFYRRIACSRHARIAGATAATGIRRTRETTPGQTLHQDGVRAAAGVPAGSRQIPYTSDLRNRRYLL